MTRDEAKRLAEKMRREGSRLDEVTEALRKAGYKSDRTGKPLGKNGLFAMLHPDGKRKIRKQALLRVEKEKKAPPQTFEPSAFKRVIQELLTLDVSDDQLPRLIRSLMQE